MTDVIDAGAVPPPVPIQAIHHFAYKSRNAEETRHFYEDILGLPLTMVVEEKDAPVTTGKIYSFVHYFFQMADGNYLAFFDFGDGHAPIFDEKTPHFANHLALRVSGEEELLSAKARLEAFGVKVDGPMNHEFVRSVYFWDPNGIRMEYAYTLYNPSEMAEEKAKAAETLARWSEKSRAAMA